MFDFTSYPQTGFADFISQRHAAGKPVLLPTGMGSEIQELGARRDPQFKLTEPLWSGSALLSAEGLGLVRQVHENAVYVTGAHAITTNTWIRPDAFKAVTDNWRAAANEAFRRGAAVALQVKREAAASDRQVYVGGSFGPLDDSHNPQHQQTFAALYATHRETAQVLANTGVDFLIPETACTHDEAIAMARAASDTGLPFILGLTPNADKSLRCGRLLAETVNELQSIRGLAGLALNCIKVHEVARPLEVLLGNYRGPIGVYANGFGSHQGLNWVFDHSEKATDAYVASVKDWHAAGATIVGGCCGTTSATYGRKLAEAFSGQQLAQAPAWQVHDHAHASVCACHL